ncbi:nuclear transport factor 2 family protein [Sphingomonas colocasiae]|uniref:Nuclear transport factor 2 family protein n=1 Tax=Sphingomonas colocasiae TaxID=1848973 RepID=A0ABS7PXE8_9SPHN|nr:nuclear transport factor 2 family protein [Sphingomonas colocasiae]MBY8825634.1 nuclear transport factor 2 family protein [Sphingomonas colocasiae]
MSFDLSDGHRFLQIMKRYCIDYVNVGDQAVTRDLMVEDYVLHMGAYEVVGRDTAYFDATASLMAQYPGLMLTLHEIATSGERLMMRFSEHGRRAKDGAFCAWGGIALYRWNGDKLVHCSVEQDYWSRRRQIETGRVDPIDAPAPAPWRVDPQPASPDAEAVVRAWLIGGGLAITPAVRCDDTWATGQSMRALDQERIDILDIFSAGEKVAFRVEQHGRVADDFAIGKQGQGASLHATGIVHVRDGRVHAGRAIRNRFDMGKRLGVATSIGA